YGKGLRRAHVAAFVVRSEGDRGSRIERETSTLRRIVNQREIAVAAEVRGCAVVGDSSAVAASIGHHIGNRNRNTVVGWAIRGPKHGYGKGLRGAHVAAFVVSGDSDRRRRINSKTSALRRIINQGHIAAAEVHG